MSNKEWVYFKEGSASLYQELDFDMNEKNDNPACIHLTNQSDFSISCASFGPNTLSEMTVKISAEQMDELAIAWCKKRCLNINKYTLEELLDQGGYDWSNGEAKMDGWLDPKDDN